MQKKVIVLSLGGSIIVPNRVNYGLLKEFRKVLLDNRSKYKFVVVCGGGHPSRVYIDSLKDEKIKERKKEHYQSFMGISVTRLNAQLMTYFFGKEANDEIPLDMKHVRSLMRRNDFVFCGALRYHRKETSDTTAAKLANYLGCGFVNLTDVKGLYDKDPKKFKDAKMISDLTSKEFYKIAKKIRYTPGQHFILDKNAARIIKKKKIITYILGPEMKNFDNFLKDRHFIGTIIS